MAPIPTVIFLQEEMKTQHERGRTPIATFIDEIIAHVNPSAKIDDVRRERWSVYFGDLQVATGAPLAASFEKAALLGGVLNGYQT